MSADPGEPGADRGVLQDHGTGGSPDQEVEAAEMPAFVRDDGAAMRWRAAQQILRDDHQEKEVEGS